MFYRTLVGGTSEPRTGFYRTFRIEPHLFRLPFWHSPFLGSFKNLLMGLSFRKGCIPGNFQEEKLPIKICGETAHWGWKRLIKERKRPIKANGLFSGTPPWCKMAPLKRPSKRSVIAEVPRLVFHIALSEKSCPPRKKHEGKLELQIAFSHNRVSTILSLAPGHSHH